VKAHIDGLDTGNEAIHRLLKSRGERDRMTREIHAETLAARRQAAGVGLYPLRAALTHVNEWRSFVAAARRDVSASFASAGDGLDRNGMLLLALNREQIRARLERAPVAELLRTYGAAQDRKDDPLAMVETEIVEALVERGIKPAKGADLRELQMLREWIGDEQTARVPSDLPDFEGLAADLDRLHARATAAEITVINPEHQSEASAVYRSQEAELLAAGAPSDREDIEAVRAEQGAAVGE
jgi:hypothetical protein